MFRPETVETRVVQERVASPSTCTVQAPHSDMPQPNFVPVRPSVSRNTHKSGVSGATSTDRSFPFTVNEMASMNCSSLPLATIYVSRLRKAMRLCHMEGIRERREDVKKLLRKGLAEEVGLKRRHRPQGAAMSVTSTAGPSQATIDAIKQKARLLSIYSMMSTTAAGSGHPTSCMSAAELMAGIFFYAMKFDPKDANSNNDDRFVLSKGHAAPVLYSALAETGVFPVSRVMTLREFSSELEGHPTPRIHGVDAATGSLGQGLSVGAGLALGARMDKSDTRVYVLLGDGEMAEGQIWEAAEFAGHYKLDNLTVIADVNALGQSEPTMYQHDMETYRKKFDSEGFATEVIDGHHVAAVLAALDRAKATKGKPQAILARTIKGHGFSEVAGKNGWHGKPFSKEQLVRAIAEQG